MAKGFAALGPRKRTKIARLGGQTISKDRDHMSDIGTKGGNAVVLEYGVNHMKSIGSRGGRKVVRRYGKSHMAEIGRKGGNARSKANV